ncbi:MAG: hypothetical protein ACKOX6_06635 [Bdellovibrio sp.]
MSTQAWFEQFKEKLQGLTEVFEQSGTPLSLLGYALKEKRLTSAEYLQWAMTHYKLPLLQARFFTETPPSKEMFAKWATHYPWSAECLPVAEWDGALIVACLQPPQDFPLMPPSVFVLTPLECIEKTWLTWNHATKKSADTPEGIDLSLATPAKQDNPDDLFSLEDLGNSSSEGENAESNDSSSEDQGGSALEGIFDNVTVARLEKTVIQTMNPLAESEPVGKEKDAAAIASEKTVIQPLTKVTPMEPTVPPPPPIEDAATAPSEDSFSNKPIPIVPRPAGVAKPTMNPVASGHFSLDKLKKKNSALLAEKVKKVLSEMKSHFEKSMILTLDEQETQVTAFAWDENFQGIKDTSLRVPLKSPSIFNIVASTQKPFHGYISLNEINEKFFDDWNNGRIPDHVTISPILLNDKLVGMLVGFAEKSAYNKVSLGLAERLSNDFTKGLAA